MSNETTHTSSSVPSTTQAIIEWDDETGEIVKFNGAGMGDSLVPVIEHLGRSYMLNCSAFGVIPGQRVLPERPDNVPADAQLGFVWVTPEVAHNYGEVYGLDGECYRYIEQDKAARIYGVTFPEPEPTPESVLDAVYGEFWETSEVPSTSDVLAAFKAAGFEIVRKADTPAKPAEVLCVNCDRPLRLNDDGSVWLAGGDKDSMSPTFVRSACGLTFP